MSSVEDRQRRNVEVVREGVEAFGRRDFDALLALTVEDFEVYLPQNLPNSGSYVGHDGFRTWIDQWLEAWDDFEVEIVDARPVGARHVIAHVRQSGRGKGSGIPVQMEVAYLWEVREGRFAAMQLYTSRDEALRAAEQREADTAD
jgi:ketosteroid isomerase-like protein